MDGWKQQQHFSLKKGGGREGPGGWRIPPLFPFPARGRHLECRQNFGDNPSCLKCSVRFCTAAFNIGPASRCHVGMNGTQVGGRQDMWPASWLCSGGYGPAIGVVAREQLLGNPNKTKHKHNTVNTLPSLPPPNAMIGENRQL